MGKRTRIVRWLLWMRAGVSHSKDFMTTVDERLARMCHLQQQQLAVLQQRLAEPDEAAQQEVLRTTEYAADRIGVEKKTIYRFTQRGELPVAEYRRRRKWFRDSDVERCRRRYGR